MDISAFIAGLDIAPESLLSNESKCFQTSHTLDATAKYLARNLADRPQSEAKYLAEADISIYDTLGPFWKSLAASFSPSSSAVLSEDARVSFALSLGKLERNLIAGRADAQVKAIDHEEHVRLLLFNLTSFTRIEDESFFALHTILAQLLSNIISPTSADPADASIADRHLRWYLSGNREDDVIIRLLDSKHAATNLTVLHLLNNLTRGSPERLNLLLSEQGIRWLSKLLGSIETTLDSEDGRFELIAGIFNSLIDLGLQAELFGKLSSPDEALSPSQATFLKLLDSRINGQSTSSSSASTSFPNVYSSNEVPSRNRFLIPVFHVLSGYCLVSMKSGEDDARLPKILEGLVLVSEILSGIGLSVQARRDDLVAKGMSTQDHEAGGEEVMLREMKSEKSDVGVVKPVVDLLAQLNQFLPRIKPLRPDSVPAPNPDTSLSDQTLPFTNIKRDLVRLLSVLSFQDKGVGDLVRENGGVQVILGLCEVDERNPYLRELALFTVRNLMLNNPENQAIIGQMDPLGLVGENGELQPLPDRMRRTPRSN